MIERLRIRLSARNTLPLLVALGAATGIVAALIMVLFRILVETVLSAYLPAGGSENFEQLPLLGRLLAPLAGGLLISLLLYLLRESHRSVGVVYVMERLAYYQGHMALRNLLTQFFGAALCLICGFSMGREGPSVHLGAAGGSLIGQGLTLPNNNIRVLVACGVAGAIAASFNTPLAGVVFAMEVVMMEYTITGFAPVIIAAVSATVVSRLVFGPAPAFAVPELQIVSMMELPYIFVMGLAIGAVSAGFIVAAQRIAQLSAGLSYWQKPLLAGLITGLLALAVPQIMGIGYDTVDLALTGKLALSALLLVLLVKVVATAVAVGLALPGGLIGPTLFMGAMAGGALGAFANAWNGPEFSSSAFYAILGMGAMMAATLNAPLAALMAMLELTNNPHIILPGMLVVITASLTVSHLFGRESIFLTLLRVRGLEYRADPVTQALQRLAVIDAMDRRFVASPLRVSRDAAQQLLAAGPRWILLEGDGQPQQLLRAADLARKLEEPVDAEVDLLEIPGARFDVAGVYFQATLREAQDAMDKAGVDMLYVWRMAGPTFKRIEGILTRQKIQSVYR